MSYSTPEKLLARVERNKQERERHELIEKFRYERDQIIKAAPYAIETDFWCRRCQQDFTRTGIKVVRTSWTTDLKLAWYATRCETCYQVCIRRITDKPADPYYSLSKMLKDQRSAQADDMLQPDDPRFKARYGDPYKKVWEQMESAERSAYKKKHL
jgi:transcription elongation factor Elf1